MLPLQDFQRTTNESISFASISGTIASSGSIASGGIFGIRTRHEVDTHQSFVAFVTRSMTAINFGSRSGC